MWRTDALQQRRLKRAGFIELLMLKDAKSFTNNLAFIGIPSGVNEPFDDLSERKGKGNGHEIKLPI